MRGVYGQLAASTLLVIGALFPIVNPLGNAPIFLALARGLPESAISRLARSIALNSFVLIIGSIFIGTHVLGFFGISLPVVQVAGGLVVVANGWALLRSPAAGDGESVNKPCRESDYMRQAFYPLTLPLTVGPGSISTAITVGANRPSGGQWHWQLITGLFIGAAVIAASVWLCYQFAERIARILGETAMNVVLRLSSFILVCIGVQIVWNGASALLRAALFR